MKIIEKVARNDEISYCIGNALNMILRQKLNLKYLLKDKFESIEYSGNTR